eukprot:m.9691 g.9691  ORF g.9691 m.9691 type:complete len:319 (-) comp2444_c0_seq1:608-1564(-)
MAARLQSIAAFRGVGWDRSITARAYATGVSGVTGSLGLGAGLSATGPGTLLSAAPAAGAVLDDARRFPFLLPGVSTAADPGVAGSEIGSAVAGASAIGARAGAGAGAGGGGAAAGMTGARGGDAGGGSVCVLLLAVVGFGVGTGVGTGVRAGLLLFSAADLPLVAIAGTSRGACALLLFESDLASGLLSGLAGIGATLPAGAAAGAAGSGSFTGDVVVGDELFASEVEAVRGNWSPRREFVRDGALDGVEIPGMCTSSSWTNVSACDGVADRGFIASTSWDLSFSMSESRAERRAVFSSFRAWACSREVSSARRSCAP